MIIAGLSGTEVCSIRPHVLIVEPDFVLLNMLARALRVSGYQESKATAATEAQMIINNGKVDLAVMECLLPDRNRIDLSAYAVKKGLPVILMSGDPREIDLCHKLPHPFVAKPFHIVKLLAIIEDVFGPPPIKGYRRLGGPCNNVT
jgi:two-component system OmpR family response regulator